MIILTITPYAEKENGKKITSFNENDWDLIMDVYERLIRNFKQTFPEREMGKMVEKDRKLILNSKSNFFENELFYLRGDGLDNIVFFGNDECVVKGEISF
jgi:hypothetical protein